MASVRQFIYLKLIADGDEIICFNKWMAEGQQKKYVGKAILIEYLES